MAKGLMAKGLMAKAKGLMAKGLMAKERNSLKKVSHNMPKHIPKKVQQIAKYIFETCQKHLKNIPK